MKSGSWLWSSSSAGNGSSSWFSPMVFCELCSLMCSSSVSTEEKASEHSAQLKGMAFDSSGGFIFSFLFFPFWWHCRCLFRSLNWPKHFLQMAQTYGRNLSWTVALCFLRETSFVKLLPQSEQLYWDVSASPAEVLSVWVTSNASFFFSSAFISFVSSVTARSAVFSLRLLFWLGALITFCFLWTSWCLIKPDAWLNVRRHCVQQ